MIVGSKNIVKSFKLKKIIIMLLVFLLSTLAACNAKKNGVTSQNQINEETTEMSKETDIITPTTIVQAEKNEKTVSTTTNQGVTSNYNYDIEYEEDSDYLDEEIKANTKKKKPHGVQLYNTQHFDTWNEKGGGKDSEGGIIIAGGGGNWGSGGGSSFSTGGVAGQSIDFVDGAEMNQAPVNISKDDTTGKDLISETMGFAKDDGQFYKENEGNNAGTKIFELDRNGSIGFDEDHISVANIKGFMSFFLFTAFGLGGLSFFMATRDVKSKNNYF